MAERYRIPEGAARFQSDRGAGMVWAASLKVVLYVVSGHGDPPLAQLSTKAWEQQFAGRRGATLFIDALGLKGYDTSFRTQMVEQARQLAEAGRLAAVHVLTRSKLVAMAATVAQLVIKLRVDVHTDIASFDSRIESLGAGAALEREQKASA